MSMTLLDGTRNTIGTTLLFILGIVIMVTMATSAVVTMMRTTTVTCMVSLDPRVIPSAITFTNVIMHVMFVLLFVVVVLLIALFP